MRTGAGSPGTGAASCGELSDLPFAGTLAPPDSGLAPGEAYDGVHALSRCAFAGSSLRGCDFSRATMSQVDLRGAELGIRIDPGSLRGAIVTSAQLAAMVPVLAECLGIVVADE